MLAAKLPLFILIREVQEVRVNQARRVLLVKEEARAYRAYREILENQDRWD